MSTFFKTVLAAGVLAVSVGALQPAKAADSCGWYAFAMATKSINSARSAANRFGGNVWDVDASNSANAGQGWYTVAKGPGSKSSARRWRNQYRARGARKAYIGNRCFYGE